MSILLAYYSLYGDIVCAYEPVLTKRFLHGRTEAMRSTTSKVTELCNIWTNSSSSKAQKVESLREATKYHSKLVKEASDGKGVDRHLYALQCIAEKNNIQVPELFKSKAWETLNRTVLSTSNCGNPALRLFGFGPVVPDGFGIGYIIKDNGIQYSISSKHRQTRRFAKTLQQTLTEIGLMLEPLTSQTMGYHGESLLKKPDLKISSEANQTKITESATRIGANYSGPENISKKSVRGRTSLGIKSFVGRRTFRRQNSLKSQTMRSTGTDLSN